MNLAPARKLTTLLFNPFVFVAGFPALGLGLAAILVVGLLASLSHTHFDGVLDTHLAAPAPFFLFLAEGFVDWLCLAASLYVVGRLAAKTSFRAIDLFGTQALARWPTILICLVTMPAPVRRFSDDVLQMLLHPNAHVTPNVTDGIIFATAVIIMLPLTVWMVVLMYESYSVSCNLRGSKAVLTFIGGLILAEILSKLALSALMRLT